MAIPKPNIATAAKTKTTSAVVNAKVLAAAAKESPLINSNQVQNQGTDGSSQDKKPRPGFEGPSPNIPDVSKPGADSYTPKTDADKQASIDQALGGVSKADAMKQLAGMGTGSTAAQSGKDRLTGKFTDLMGSTSTNNNPGIDQGFGPSPDGAALAAMVGGGKTGSGTSVMNPMTPYQGGSVGGLLGGAAAAGVNSIGQMGTSLISVEPAAAPAEEPSYLDAAINFISSVVTSVLGGAGQTSNASKLFSPAGAVVGTAAGILTANGTPEDKANEFRGLAAIKRQGESRFLNKNTDEQLDQIDFETPDPDKRYGNDYMISQSMLDQLIVSKSGRRTSQGGSSDATPVDDGGIPQAVSSIDVNLSSIDGRNLFGQPLPPGVENVSGGNKGIDGFGRSNGAGVIDPGGEGGIPGGDPRFQQDPANALPGNKTAPTLQSPVGTQESQSSSVSTTLAAGTRNLTLTGTAAINGTGNALDNLINGNRATNELRGEAGNDLLDGGAGRDQLTGGSGADRFRFSSAGSFGTTQADRITDFSRSDGDRIELSRSAFGLATSASLSFQAVSNDADLSRALGSSTLLIQDLRDGSMLFNQNGTAAGAGQGGVFAVVSQGLTLQACDFALGA